MSSQEKEIHFHDTNQKFWQLGLILSSGFGLVSAMVGGQVSTIYGTGTVITSIFFGNFILWFIGFIIISMTHKRAHAIENFKDYLGRFSVSIATVILSVAFIIWYSLQIKIPAQISAILVKEFTGLSDTELKIGAILGSMCALLSIGGFKTIKWINTTIFPVLFISLIIMIIYMDHAEIFYIPWSISFNGICLIVLTWLPGTVNLSTFFRHARSKADSVLGLSLMMLCHSAFQYCFALLSISTPLDLIGRYEVDHNILEISAIVAFIFFSFLCVNLLNIYWASIGIEVFIRRKQEPKGYAIIGLAGTIIYMFFQSSITLFILEKLVTIFISNLGAILVIGFLMKVITQHRVRTSDKLLNSFCWLIGCCVSIAVLSMHSQNVLFASLSGINACLLSFAIVMFLEEIQWSLRRILNR